MNMQHYNNLKTLPADALKPILAGRLKGKSDINPQWRVEAMTKEFGVCGIGWKYEVAETWTVPASGDQLLIFAQINLYVKDGEAWSAAIPAIGGDFVIKKETGGLYVNDESYKMAVTDALGVAMKFLGVAADVYRGLVNDSKYGYEPKGTPTNYEPKGTPTNANVSPAALKPVATPPGSSEVATVEQSSKLMEAAHVQGLSTDDMKGIIQFKYKKDSSKKLNSLQITYLTEHLAEMWALYVATQSMDKANFGEFGSELPPVD